MKKLITLCFFTIAGFTYSSAQTVTWAEDIACLIYSHCSRCHNNTSAVGAIPMSNYEEVWSQRYSINYYISKKSMPPYLAGTEKNRYTHEKSLSDNEIALINEWVKTGCPKGDLGKEPPQPKFPPLISQITSPDFSNRIPAYKVPDVPGFQYRCFVYPTTYLVEKYISEIEVLPTDLSAVYSVFVYSDTSSIPLNLDKADPGNGYANYSGTGSPSSKLLYGWVNGNPLYHTPPNMALRLDANAHLIIRVLFAEDAQNKTESTQLNLKFDNSDSSRVIDVATFLNHTTNLQNPPFFIPADSIITFYEQYTVPSDISIMGIAPLAHKICVSMGCFAISPVNDTINLIEIEDYEDLFSQGFYYFEKPQKIPKGSIIYAFAEYDNTGANGNNPFSPSHNITSGITDTSEAMAFSFSFLPYQANDEKIITDSVIHLAHYINCSPAHTVSSIKQTYKNESDILIFPNPFSISLSIQFLNEPVSGTVYVISIIGKTVAEQNIINAKTTEFNLSDLVPGQYYLKIKTDNNVRTHKLIKL